MIDWYPGQIVKLDKEQEEMKMHFVHRSSSNRYWFVGPELFNYAQDISWESEGEGNKSCPDIHSKITLTLYFLHLLAICYIFAVRGSP